MKPALALLSVIMACLPASAQTSAPAPAQLKILAREEWGAKPPVAEMKRHEPKWITIHHTATPQKAERPLAEKMRALQTFSQNEGKLGNGKPKPAWPDVPYHFYIDCHGGVAQGREVNFVGDTNTEYDPTGHVLVTLEGNFEEEKVTDAQWNALRQLVTDLAGRYHVAPADVRGHLDYAKTQCPGRALQERLSDLRGQLGKTTD